MYIYIYIYIYIGMITTEHPRHAMGPRVAALPGLPSRGLARRPELLEGIGTPDPPMIIIIIMIILIVIVMIIIIAW